MRGLKNSFFVVMVQLNQKISLYILSLDSSSYILQIYCKSNSGSSLVCCAAPTEFSRDWICTDRFQWKSTVRPSFLAKAKLFIERERGCLFQIQHTKMVKRRIIDKWAYQSSCDHYGWYIVQTTLISTFTNSQLASSLREWRRDSQQAAIYTLTKVLASP